MIDRQTKSEIDKLKSRHADLGQTIEDLLEAISRGSTTTDAVLSAELTKARKELASIARRLQGLQHEDD